MPAEDASFLLPPPAPPERKGVLRVILLLSAVAHVVAMACFARTPAESAPQAHAGKTVRVLRGEVTTNETGETGLRLLGYADRSLGARTP